MSRVPKSMNILSDLALQHCTVAEVLTAIAASPEPSLYVKVLGNQASGQRAVAVFLKGNERDIKVLQATLGIISLRWAKEQAAAAQAEAANTPSAHYPEVPPEQCHDFVASDGTCTDTGCQCNVEAGKCPHDPQHKAVEEGAAIEAAPPAPETAPEAAPQPPAGDTVASSCTDTDDTAVDVARKDN